jgi:hypothetical protein
MTRIALLYELSDRGPAGARLPVTWPPHRAPLMGRRSLREMLAERPVPGPAACLATDRSSRPTAVRRTAASRS